MKTQTWRVTKLLFSLTALAVLTLVSCQGQARDVPSATKGPDQVSSQEVRFTSPCSDIVDPWTPMSQDERAEACRELISSKTAELGDVGFAPQDCQVTAAEVQECGIGTELACTYSCGDTAE